MPMAGPMAGPMVSWKSSGNHCAFFVSRRMKDLAGCITKVPLTLYIIFFIYLYCVQNMRSLNEGLGYKCYNQSNNV